jgi:hypothetical protein
MKKGTTIVLLIIQAALCYSQTEKPLDLSPVGQFLKRNLVDSSSISVHLNASFGGSKLIRTITFKPDFQSSFPTNMTYSGDLRFSVIPDNSSNLSRRLVLEQGFGYTFYKGMPDEWRITGPATSLYGEPPSEIIGFEEIHALSSISMIGLEFGMRNTRVGIFGISNNHILLNRGQAYRVKRVIPYLGFSFRVIPAWSIPISGIDFSIQRSINGISEYGGLDENYIVLTGINLSILRLKSCGSIKRR